MATRVDRMILMEKQRKTWEKHQKCVKKMQGIVNANPPMLRTSFALRPSKLKEDEKRYEEIMKQNIELLARINRIQRMGMNTSNYYYKENHPKAVSPAFARLEKRIQHLQHENHKLGNFLRNVKARVKSFRPLSVAEKGKLLKTKQNFQLPMNILEKYDMTHIKIPEGVPSQRRLFRPEIYFDINIDGIRDLGRLVIRLYTEAAPQVVLQILRLCSAGENEEISIQRLFPKLWIEMEIALRPKSALINKSIEYDKRVISHKQKGVLSIPEQYLKGFVYGVLCFSISFRPLNVLNGRRLAFGKVIKGYRSLEIISEYGTRNGRPFSPIVIKSCGVL